MDVNAMLVPLRAERKRLDTAIAALETLESVRVQTTPRAGISENAASSVSVKKNRRRRKPLSAETRKKMSDATKARWAKLKANSSKSKPKTKAA